MPSIECLPISGGRLLMIRGSRDGAQQEALSSIGGAVRHGESPLQACLRLVKDETGFYVEPSCAAVVFAASAGQATDYCLIFVAAAPSQALGPGPSARDSLVWIDLDELTGREDITELDRVIIPRVLGSSAPIAIFLDIDPATTPPARTLREISNIDVARLSPLVFAVTS